MKFFDHANITIESGKWWDGCSSARRESGVPYGWPNGGNGWRGWHVYINVDPQLNTLMPFKYHKIHKAASWSRGESREKYGKNAEDLVLYVPLGTVIKDRSNGHVLFVAEAVLDIPYLLLKWWDGGAGNMHFKNSILQYPDFCLNGEPWQYLELELELQLLSDIGLIGTPSVGKSSIINMVSNAKAQVAEYHFTTITPNLGSVSCDGVDWNVIDIPGLIEWASDGKGLGIEFLRHILKCSIFNFVIDFGRWDAGIAEFGVLWNEILTYCRTRFAEEYDVTPDEIYFTITNEDNVLILTIWYGSSTDTMSVITRKVLLWTINKSDESEDQELRNEYQAALTAHIVEAMKSAAIYNLDDSLARSLITHNTWWTSTYLHEGMTELIYQWKQLIEKYNHTGDIAWHTYAPIDMTKPHNVTLLETKDVTEIDWYLEAKPYLIDEDDSLESQQISNWEENGDDFWKEDDRDEDDSEEIEEVGTALLARPSEQQIFGDGEWDDEIFYDHWDPSISEDQIVHRNIVGAIVYDTRTDQYIVTEQLGTDWRKFMWGGIDAWESPEQAIMREIEEELGFSQIENLIDLWTINSKRYHPSKNEYISWEITCFYIEVNSTTAWTISEKEKQTQAIHYLNEEDIINRINVSWCQYFWEIYQDLLEEWDIDDNWEEDSETQQHPTTTKDVPLQTVRIRSIYEPDITRIVYMVQWWNDQAEQWFWKYMQKSWWITWLKNHKVKHGDILVFEHPYYGVEERQIIFEA
jgi:Obg family GTPase CgtA